MAKLACTIGLIGALAVGGCRREQPIFVTKVYPAEALPHGLSADTAVASVEAALKGEGFILAEGSTHNHVGKVDVRRDSRSGQGDRWIVQIKLQPRDSVSEEAVPQMEGTGETPADEALPTAAQLAQAAKGAAAELAEERRLLKKPKGAVEQALSGESRRLRDFAVRLAGARRMRDVVPALCQRLNDEPEPELVLRTVGALVQIGDDRAVGPLVELTKRKHPLFINQIVYAVAQIGGQEAEAYLDTLAQGHPSDQVRNAAREALSELLSRKSAKLKH